LRVDAINEPVYCLTESIGGVFSAIQVKNNRLPACPGGIEDCHRPFAENVAGQPGLPDWLTGIGTVAVAIVAVGVALYAEWRADQRVAAERKHSAQVLAEERKLADDRLPTRSDRHLERIRDKTAARRRTELVRYAIQAGIDPVAPPT
jgi:hypothetical protein